MAQALDDDPTRRDRRAHDEAMSLPWSNDAKEALETILREIAKEGIQPGDRRQYKSVGAAQAFAYLNGADVVTPEHLEILASVLWEDPIEQPEKVAQIIAKIANPTGMRVNQLLLETEQILNSTDVKQLSEAATATAKLQDVDKQLRALTKLNVRRFSGHKSRRIRPCF